MLIECFGGRVHEVLICKLGSYNFQLLNIILEILSVSGLVSNIT